ncbi:phospholipid carrier-dependent glycosyltransferase [Microbacterium sp. X-17]|uniref:dolichyl-phosphate-mannose--protein mannosyltransferase n=1 Tax=Microbacterium sp. X-17 TaxID=3144404 RepID=UPI0031F5030A
MSTTDPLLPVTRASWYDSWMSAVRADPRRTRLLGILAPIIVTLLAAVLRMWRLGDPHALVFDETYYVKDAWSQWNLGFPGNWPDDPNPGFQSGDVNAFLSSGSFVVHPPLGKWIIGAGMWLFGADSSFGWRISAAVFGTATVLVLYFLARTLTRSTVFATIAAFLMAIDGLAIVTSRISLLDIFLTFFVVLTFWFVLLDRNQRDRRLAAALAARSAGRRWGPVLWNRPWLLAAGAAVGAATAVKWSGVIVIVAVGIYVVVSDALARRRLGVTLWPVDALRQGLASFVLLVPIALAVYLASWTGWLTTDGGYSRHAADADPATGLWAWVPLPFQSLWKYHQAMYAFHAGLSTPHAYASPAWQWPFLVRPTSMYWNQTDGTVEAISSIPNPLIWWGGVAAAIWLIYRFVVTRSSAYAFVLVGIAATYLPWPFYPDRTMFQFYTIVILPFLVLALTFALREIAGAPGAPPERRRTGQRVVIVALVAIAVLSAFWYPVWTALPVPYDFWRLHNWIPTWI